MVNLRPSTTKGGSGRRPSSDSISKPGSGSGSKSGSASSSKPGSGSSSKPSTSGSGPSTPATTKSGDSRCGSAARRRRNERYIAGGKITLFGDSITRYAMDPDNGCWAAYLAHELCGYYTVDVKGFPGYITNWALDLSPRFFTKEYLKEVEYMVIFFGHNDPWNPKKYPTCSPGQFKDNLLMIIQFLIEDGLKKEQIMLISPGWYDEPAWMEYQKQRFNTDIEKTFEHCEKYAKACVEVAQERGVTFIDWWRKSIEYQPLSELFTDGLHFSRKGARVFFDTIWPVINEYFTNLHGVPLDYLTSVETPNELLKMLKEAVYMTDEQKRVFLK